MWGQQSLLSESFSLGYPFQTPPNLLCLDSKSFRISNLNSGKRNQIAVNFSETEVQSYKSVTVDIDFTQASATTNLNDQESFETTTETDLNGITIYFFNNLNGASTNYTTYFKNIKFEKVVE